MKISGPQWEDTLRSKAYPFDTPNLPQTRRGTKLPVGFIRDLVVFMSSPNSRARLAAITVTPNTTPSVVLGFTDTAGRPVGTAEIPPGVSGRVAVMSDGINTGFVDVGEDAAKIVRGWFPGEYVFNAPILPRLVVVSDPAWRPAVVLPDGTALTGDVYIVGTGGVRFVAVDSTTVRVDAVGDPYAGRDTPRRALRTLAETTPAEGGDIMISAQGAPGQAYRARLIPLSGGRIRVEVQG